MKWACQGAGSDQAGWGGPWAEAAAGGSGAGDGGGEIGADAACGVSGEGDAGGGDAGWGDAGWGAVRRGGARNGGGLIRKAQQRERSGLPSETGATATSASISGSLSIVSTSSRTPLACQYSSRRLGISGISQPNVAGSGLAGRGDRWPGDARAAALRRGL
jgi:hypothetical protein